MFDKDAIHVSKKELMLIEIAVETYHALLHTFEFDVMLNTHERRALKKNIIRSHRILEKLRGEQK